VCRGRSGLLLAIFGTALTRNDRYSLLGFGVVCLSLIRKLWIEERWMLAAFQGEYLDYKAQVAALIPFVF
jgi:protein-S-isoprenylcysteine O-methyltransferase Ste14